MVSQYVVHGIAVAGLLCAFAGAFLVIFAVPANTPRRLFVGLAFANILWAISQLAGAVKALPQIGLVPLGVAIVGFVTGTFAPPVVGGNRFRDGVAWAGLTLAFVGMVALIVQYVLQRLGIAVR